MSQSIKYSLKGIKIDSYDVTIFPAETVNHSKTLRPASKDKSGKYSVWFLDLQGNTSLCNISFLSGSSTSKAARRST